VLVLVLPPPTTTLLSNNEMFDVEFKSHTDASTTPLLVFALVGGSVALHGSSPSASERYVSSVMFQVFGRKFSNTSNRFSPVT
jgi:hypothetical protein